MLGKLISDKYEVLEELGRGGMGRVYKVRHCGLGQVFALKMLREVFSGEEQLLSRFHDEARIMAQLRHPNIVRVFDIDKDGDHYYFVMDYIEGDTLNDLIEAQGALSIPETVRISNEIGKALIYAHSQKPAVVHRDIKPSNIMLEKHTGRVVVTDFGIAKVLDQDRTQLTQVGFMVGTPGYAPPEQLRSEHTLDGRADVFSFGLVIYEMLAGKHFFEDKSAEEIIGLKLFDPRELIPQFEKPVPAHLKQAITRAIAKEREQRYQSVQDLLDALSQARDEKDNDGKKASVTAPSLVPPLLAFAAVAAIIAGAWLWFRYQPQPVPALLPASRVAADESSAEAKPPEPAPVQVEPVTETKKPLAETSEPAPDRAEIGSAAAESGQSEVAGPQIATTQNANQAPVLIAWKPESGSIEMHAGQEQSFSVEAVDIEEDPNLTYRWLFDEKPVSDETAWRFISDNNAAGEHSVKISVADSQGAQTERSWRVNVVAAGSAPALQVDYAEQKSVKPACGPISEAEVNQWLEKYRQALQNRDINMLDQLGALYSAQELARLKNRERYESLIQGVHAVVGEAAVELQFEQVDRWYDPKSYSMVVDYLNRNLVLTRQGCEGLVARRK